MKLAEAAKYLKEVDDEDKGTVPPISGGGTISSKQAAKILRVSVSRIRQMIADGSLIAAINPRPGDRDHEIKLKDVQQLKNNMPKKGRPFKKGASKNKSKDKKDSGDEGESDKG